MPKRKPPSTPTNRAQPLPSPAAVKTYQYRSPSRPLDLGWAKSAAEAAGVDFAIDWPGTTMGPWTKATVYSFFHPLPERFVAQWSLEALP